MDNILNYLDKDSYTLSWDRESGYTNITLVYTKDDRLMRKTILTKDHWGNVKVNETKEKAFGGHNGGAIFKAMLREARAKAKSAVLKDAIKKELEDHEIFLGD